MADTFTSIKSRYASPISGMLRAAVSSGRITTEQAISLQGFTLALRAYSDEFAQRVGINITGRDRSGNIDINAVLKHDAFTHDFTSAIVAIEFGQFAARFMGDMREFNQDVALQRGQNFSEADVPAALRPLIRSAQDRQLFFLLDRNSDLWNNWVGRTIGQDYVYGLALNKVEQLRIAGDEPHLLIARAVVEATNNGTTTTNFMNDQRVTIGQFPEFLQPYHEGGQLREVGRVPGLVQLEANARSQLRELQSPLNPRCFSAGTPILMADGTYKPIETIEVGDWVASFDQSEDRGRGPLKPGRVTRLYRNREEVFDYLGLRTTPGHHWIDGTTGHSERIDRILELDGVVLRDDGTRVRARTGFRVGGNDDRPVKVVWRDEAGELASMLMRAGTICMTDKDDPMLLVSILAAMRRQGCELRDDGLFSDSSGNAAPFLWPHGKPSAHLEIGAEIPFRDLLRMVKSQWPLTAFIGPADDSGPTPRRRPQMIKAPGENRHERRAAIAKARKDVPAAGGPAIVSAAASGGSVTHVDADSQIGALLG